MKKSRYVDYAKASEYFTDKDKALKEEINAVESQKRFVTWVQEFSKKIVIIVFLLYVTMTAISAFFVYISFKTGVVSGIDTMISEINQTFREIVGGYIIKSAVENSFKIVGNYFIGICDARLKVMEHTIEKQTKVKIKNDNDQNNNYTDEYQ